MALALFMIIVVLLSQFPSEGVTTSNSIPPTRTSSAQTGSTTQNTQSMSRNEINATFFTWKKKILDCKTLSDSDNKLILFLELVTPTRVNKTLILSTLDHSLHIENLTLVPWESPKRVKHVHRGFLLVGPSQLVLIDRNGNSVWNLAGNFTDAVEIDEWIYALEFVDGRLYLARIDIKGKVHERNFVAEISRDVMEKLKYLYKESPPILLTDGHYLYAFWYDLKGREAPGNVNSSRNATESRVIKMAKFYSNGSLVYTGELINRSVGGGISAITLDNKIVLSVWSFNCSLVFADKNGKVITRIKNPVYAGLPTSFGCLGGLRSFSGRLYHFGWYSMVGFLDLLREDSLVEETFLNMQENNAVGDIYLWNGTLYVCGLVQGPQVSGAFIAKMDPYLKEDLNSILRDALKRGSVIEVDKVLGRG